MPKEISLDLEFFPVASNILGEAVSVHDLSRDDADTRIFDDPNVSVSLGSSLHPAVAMQRALEEESGSLVETLAPIVSRENADVLVRFFIEKQSLRTIARAQGVSVEAVSRRLMRLRAKFPSLDALWCGAHVGWTRVKPAKR